MEFFENDTLRLVCSGVGKVRSAAAVVFARMQDGLESNFTLVNIGIGGASRQSGLSIGETFLIHKIVDCASRRAFFPDMLVDTGLAETHLTTVDRPVLANSAVSSNSDDAGNSTDLENPFSSGIVDMEGSGFFEAASLFVSPHRIACMKVVSDHFECTLVSKRKVEELVEGALPALDRLIDAYCTSDAVFSSVDHRAVEGWVESVADILRLTFSQKVQLREWSTRRFALGITAMPPLDGILSPPKDKQERSRRLAEIRKRLLSP